MTRTITVSDEVYAQLESLAVGFEDTASNVIQRLINSSGIAHSRSLSREQSSATKRIYTNKQIQQLISNAARELSSSELLDLCDEETSKAIFGISFPLFIRVESKENEQVKKDAVKTRDGVPRWSWKFSFEKGGYAYAICTQWYPKNDPFVAEWLRTKQTHK